MVHQISRFQPMRSQHTTRPRLKANLVRPRPKTLHPCCLPPAQTLLEKTLMYKLHTRCAHWRPPCLRAPALPPKNACVQKHSAAICPAEATQGTNALSPRSRIVAWPCSINAAAAAQSALRAPKPRPGPRWRAPGPARRATPDRSAKTAPTKSFSRRAAAAPPAGALPQPITLTCSASAAPMCAPPPASLARPRRQLRLAAPAAIPSS
jgi:hypothetical protein